MSINIFSLLCLSISLSLSVFHSLSLTLCLFLSVSVGLSLSSSPSPPVQTSKMSTALFSVLWFRLHHKNVLSPLAGVCGRCLQTISGDTNACSALENVYHIGCFTCVGCSELLPGNYVVSTLGTISFYTWCQNKIHFESPATISFYTWCQNKIHFESLATISFYTWCQNKIHFESPASSSSLRSPVSSRWSEM